MPPHLIDLAVAIFLSKARVLSTRPEGNGYSCVPGGTADPSPFLQTVKCTLRALGRVWGAELSTWGVPSPITICDLYKI